MKINLDQTLKNRTAVFAKKGTFRAAFPEVQKFIAYTFNDLVMLKCPSTAAACNV
jgi:4'-phosphopantetheinyl transferase EntD